MNRRDPTIGEVREALEALGAPAGPSSEHAGALLRLVDAARAVVAASAGNRGRAIRRLERALEPFR